MLPKGTNHPAIYRAVTDRLSPVEKRNDAVSGWISNQLTTTQALFLFSFLTRSPLPLQDVIDNLYCK
ncbi:hypothetical protein EI42_04343 [Thermosporothrix hazakensis]|uniref:Uncharacterized protein n=1 Tax=Thermosporothrix hazakensis TaxID=644383 RepID=A0A326UB57_THEHA|nr:hypothetical protein EI42_04343 [Thermosporothrix hazakensis]